MIVHLFALIVALQGPVPTPAKTSQPPQKQDTAHKPVSQPPLPLPATVEPVPGGKTAQNEQHASSDGWLAAFTFGLLVVAILQWRTFEKHADLFRESGVIMDKQLDVMRDQEKWLRQSAGLVKDQRDILDKQANILAQMNAKESRWEATFREEILLLTRAVYVAADKPEPKRPPR